MAPTCNTAPAADQRMLSAAKSSRILRRFTQPKTDLKTGLKAGVKVGSIAAQLKRHPGAPETVPEIMNAHGLTFRAKGPP